MNMLVKARHNVPAYQRETVPFLGLNRSDDTKEGEFSYQKNLSDRRYPFLSPRLPRSGNKPENSPDALFFWDGHEIVVSGGVLYLDGKSTINVVIGPKQFAVVNTKLIVWPDGIFVDLTNAVAKSLRAEAVNKGNAIFDTASLTLEPQSIYSSGSMKYKWSGEAPEIYVWSYSDVSWDETNGWSLKGEAYTNIRAKACIGRYYIPTVSYNSASNSYTAIAPKCSYDSKTADQTVGNDIGFYCRFTGHGDGYSTQYSGETTLLWNVYWAQQANGALDQLFEVGDTVTITGTDKTYCKENIVIKSIDAQKNKITFEKDTFSAAKTTQDHVTITRRVPDLDYICERENRLWGVSNKDNTIYVSALGDPTNFYDYSGDSGSFAVAVGSEGDFTGICDYGNAVLCWKERTLHKVLGDYPSNYQTATYRFSGVRAGAHKSLANVNETLFFLGVDGVYAYTGNKPSLISRALGSAVLKDGVGGTDGRAYYLSVRNGEAWELLAYDTHTGLWSRSDEVQVVDFCRVGDDVKFLSDDTVYTIGGGEESVEWEAVFVPMYETLEGGKQYNRLIFRVEVPRDGYLAADVRFDGGRWMQVGIVKGKSGPVQLPVPLRRCDKFEIRLRGKGDCAVLDMVREFRLRGDR